jgi:hypothetical protein
MFENNFLTYLGNKTSGANAAPPSQIGTADAIRHALQQLSEIRETHAVTTASASQIITACLPTAPLSARAAMLNVSVHQLYRNHRRPRNQFLWVLER